MLKLILDSLDGLSDVMKAEYEQNTDGTFKLKLDGDPPELADSKSKLKEFRDNNIKLLKDAEETAKKLKAVEGLDPAEVAAMKEKLEALQKKGGVEPKDVDAKIREAIATHTAPLKDEIAKERQARVDAEHSLKRKDLESKLRNVGTGLKILPSALTDFLSRGLNTFNLDGIAMDGEKQLWSEDKPNEALGMDEWGKLLLTQAPHLFEASSGGGTGSGGKGRTGGKKTIDGSDPVELGRNIDAIAKGEVIVVNSGSQ